MTAGFHNAGIFYVTDLKQGEYLETLLQQLQESLLTNARPVQVAFHIYELLSESGYDDEQIEEVSAALADIVA